MFDATPIFYLHTNTSCIKVDPKIRESSFTNLHFTSLQIILNCKVTSMQIKIFEHTVLNFKVKI